MEKEGVKFRLDEGTQKINDLREQRQALNSEIYGGLERTTEAYGRLSEANLEQAMEEGTKLEKALRQVNGYSKTIQELSSGLQEGLTEFIEKASEAQHYQGVGEKSLALLANLGIKFAGDKANKMRIERIKTQSPAELLQMQLDYAEMLHREICEVREDAIRTYERLEINGDVIVAKITEYEPKQAQLHEKLTAMEEVYEQKDLECQTADAARQAVLQKELNDMNKQLVALKHEYQQALTVYNQAQQAVEANKQARNSFESMQLDLGRQATMIKEKMDNISEIYFATPEAVKIMMTTAGMETLDKTLNVTTDKSLDLIIASAGAVRDTTLLREETQLIDERSMRGYINRMNDITKDFNARYDSIRKSAAKSQEQRYGSDSAQ